MKKAAAIFICIVILSAGAFAIKKYCADGRKTEETTGTAASAVTEIPTASVPGTAALPETATETQTETTTVTTTAKPTAVSHSSLYIKGVSADDILKYFSEVMLSSEYAGSKTSEGKVKKWTGGINYCVTGIYTSEDVENIKSFFGFLSSIDGFPQIRKVTLSSEANFVIEFCTKTKLRMKFTFDDSQDVAAFTNYEYYDSTNEIHSAHVYFCFINPDVQRESIVQEEIMNSIGFSNDSVLREDSVVYQYSNSNLISNIDIVLLRLLYSPQMKAGMGYDEVSRVIKSLYY